MRTYYEGKASFKGADGKPHQILWKVKRLPIRKKRFGKRSRIVYLLIDYDDRTEVLYNNYWIRRPNFFRCRPCFEFYRFLKDIYG